MIPPPPAPPPCPDFQMHQPEDERAAFFAGVRAFNERDFFEAHEGFEAAWMDAIGHRAAFYQGLCQTAVMFEHAVRGNLAGVHKMHRSVHRRLDPLPSPFMCLDLTAFLAAVDASVLPLLAHPPLSPYRDKLAGSAPREVGCGWTASMVPTIDLLGDPFDLGEASAM